MLFIACGAPADGGDDDDVAGDDDDGYEDNEDGDTQDFLTPAFYHAGSDDSFRHEVNRSVHFARKVAFRHPLEDDAQQVQGYSTGKLFGDGTGPAGTSEHHPAADLHIGSGETAVDLYASHDGYVSTYEDAPKYRHYLSITKEIEGDDGQSVARLVTLYAHLDLDLDEADGLLMDGQTVQAGDRISGHLYAETVGGPHLHYEIRYYRPADVGDENFYGSDVGPDADADLTEPSAGPWSYGVWNPQIGYGFGDPLNHGLLFD